MTTSAPDLEQLVAKGVEAQRVGNNSAAIAIYQEVLASQPAYPVALYSLASICLNQGQGSEGLGYARRCLAVAPGSALAWYIHGAALKAVKRFDEALRNLSRAAELDGNYVEPLFEEANIHLVGQDFVHALACFDRILTIEPDHTLASGNRAKLLALLPGPINTFSDQTLRGLALQNEGNTEAAQVVFRQILEETPTHFVALYSMAAMCINQGQTEEGRSYSERCLRADSTSPFGWYIHGCALKACRRFTEAQHHLDRALAINPSYKEAFIEKGITFGETKDYVQALFQFNHVLQIDPEHKLALVNLATSLTILKRNDEASQFFDRLLSIDPHHDYVLGALAHSRLHSCNWTDFEASRERIIQAVRAGKRACKPLAFLAISDSPEDQSICSKTFSEQAYPISKEQLWAGEYYGHQKPRIGYVSPDFREHPVGHLMAGVFEHHDKSKFEIYAFSLGIDDGSTLRHRFMNASDRFFDVRGKTSREIAGLIRSLEIDILIDLAGPTMDAQPDIFSFRPAPVQAGYLGYPGTSGASYYDYVIADPTVVPAYDSRFYSEKVVRVPGCYLPTDSKLSIAPSTPTRESMHLPPEGFIYCSFNHDYKINPDCFGVWMRILARVPGSVLWLMKLNDSAEANLRKEAEIRGISAARLIFATRLPAVEDHLARYRLAGLFLDTFPYNAHSTATDVLRTGLPIITVIGNSFQSRVAASVLNTIGMPQLAFRNTRDYEDFAVEMAECPEKLSEVKHELLSKIESAPLFNTQLTTTQLERTFEVMLAEKGGDTALTSISYEHNSNRL